MIDVNQYFEVDNVILMTTERSKKKPFFYNDDIISKENYKMGDD